ncbi:hypothetical protein GCM10009661_45420 [Catellatospora chokoriensis]|uniref:PIN domain-containing protein n=1 Tax=Catellatospora chokoriensis TaxID=310353 RepID=A0A8J3KAD1_9ACTN|nr:hypothetical protein Cch02nite_49380 [Catellatospora chokoriensis]
MLDRMVAEVNNARGFSGNAAQWLVKYLDWATDTADALHNQLRPEEINRLVFTPRYSALLAAAGTDIATTNQRVVNGLLRSELQQRVTEFEQLRDAVRGQINRWSEPAMFIVCDTDFLLHNGNTLGHIDFHRVIIDAGPEHQYRLGDGINNVHLLIPSQVLLELDRQKNTNRDVRTAARVTLRTIDDWFEKPDRVYRERLANGTAFGGDAARFSAELLLDPLGHVPMEIGDDEIIDRILSAKPLVGRDITLITFDTHMSTKARINGVPVIKLQQPEPPEKKGKSGQ